mmetsp:Transcript_39668/g.88778  ORF Transcript_39668/g.88778 Transcript_39668/m.88778 type:complete len:365 (+) Transcript_39668:96-1190(+)
MATAPEEGPCFLGDRVALSLETRPGLLSSVVLELAEPREETRLLVRVLELREDEELDVRRSSTEAARRLTAEEPPEPPRERLRPELRNDASSRDASRRRPPGDAPEGRATRGTPPTPLAEDEVEEDEEARGSARGGVFFLEVVGDGEERLPEEVWEPIARGGDFFPAVFSAAVLASASSFRRFSVSSSWAFFWRASIFSSHFSSFDFAAVVAFLFPASISACLARSRSARFACHSSSSRASASRTSRTRASRSAAWAAWATCSRLGFLFFSLLSLWCRCRAAQPPPPFARPPAWKLSSDTSDPNATRPLARAGRSSEANASAVASSCSSSLSPWVPEVAQRPAVFRGAAGDPGESGSTARNASW